MGITTIPIREYSKKPDHLVRLGSSTTVSDEKLRQSCKRSYRLWGVHATSFLEVPDNSFELLNDISEESRRRSQWMVAKFKVLEESGFIMLPTARYPHWSVILPSENVVFFEKLRTILGEPVPNPFFERSKR